MLEPVTLSLGLHVVLHPPPLRSCPRARVWVRRRAAALVDVLRDEAPDVLLDAVVNRLHTPSWAAAALWLLLWLLVFVL